MTESIDRLYKDQQQDGDDYRFPVYESMLLDPRSTLKQWHELIMSFLSSIKQYSTSNNKTNREETDMNKKTNRVNKSFNGPSAIAATHLPTLDTVAGHLLIKILITKMFKKAQKLQNTSSIQSFVLKSLMDDLPIFNSDNDDDGGDVLKLGHAYWYQLDHHNESNNNHKMNKSRMLFKWKYAYLMNPKTLSIRTLAESLLRIIETQLIRESHAGNRQHHQRQKDILLNTLRHIREENKIEICLWMILLPTHLPFLHNDCSNPHSLTSVVDKTFAINYASKNAIACCNSYSSSCSDNGEMSNYLCKQSKRKQHSTLHKLMVDQCVYFIRATSSSSKRTFHSAGTPSSHDESTNTIHPWLILYVSFIFPDLFQIYLQSMSFQFKQVFNSFMNTQNDFSETEFKQNFVLWKQKILFLIINIDNSFRQNQSTPQPLILLEKYLIRFIQDTSSYIAEFSSFSSSFAYKSIDQFIKECSKMSDSYT